MKFVWWIVSMCIGAAAGYGLSFVIATHVFLLIGAGMMVGNAVSITYFIHAAREELSFEEEPPEENTNSENS